MAVESVTPTLADLVGKLEALGSSRQIADFLQEQGTRAVRNQPQRCAVAQYVNRATGGCSSVGAIGAFLWLNGVLPEEVQYPGGPLNDFVIDFDCGKYPELIAHPAPLNEVRNV